MLLLLLAGCSTMTEERLGKKISNKLDDVDRYYAELEAEVYSLEGEQSYRIRQWLQKPDKWRVEVESDTTSQIFICDGEHVYVYQPGIEDYYRLEISIARDTVAPPFFLVGYLEQLLNATSYTFEGEREKDGEKYYSVSFAELHRDESTRLWLDKRTLLPVIMETTSDGEPLSRIICTKLDLKPDFPDDLFIFEAPGVGEVASHCLIKPLSLDEARDDWPHTVYMPEYLPQGTFLFVISQGEEHGREQLVSIYKGEKPFILVQRPIVAASPPFMANGTRKVLIGQITAYYHPNSSDELSTLWWSNDTTTFILTGNLSLQLMSQIASSLQPT
jgi:outer membrane lipoprotein-sorting protein